ncbi:hypothetical protein [Gallaecimonas pentaromativorans]|uniref:hypothetical protein n=1 Tax=Gallaecimonas pentaromativorans TaxID=584787 RepID=UPI003A8DECCB
MSQRKAALSKTEQQNCEQQSNQEVGKVDFKISKDGGMYVDTSSQRTISSFLEQIKKLEDLNIRQ